jgi:phosphoribosylamine--glycine ligase
MKTKVTIIGNGGREDSLRWKLSTEQVEVESEVSEHLTIIGPEAPIAEGLTDELESKLIPVFGPSKLAGRLETSKLWAKQFMQRNDIPTAHWVTYTRDDIEEVILKTHGYPFVIKEDGLCDGKGVAVCESQTKAYFYAGIYASNKFNSPSNKILIEDFIHGEEASCFVLTDGKSYKVLPYCQDHKRVGEGDTGPNTGGMGAYAPAPLMTEELQERVKKEIIEPTINGMQEEGIPYKGVLYIGLMICNGDPYVIEYNVRFGDPECQVLMMLMKSELLPYLEAVAFEILDTLPDPEFYEGSAMTVVMCSEGYPGEYKKGFEIDFCGHHNFQPQLHTQVFHAGVKSDGDNYVTDGGRVLNVSARGKTLQEARDRVYELAEKISWEGSFYRKDIGHRALGPI